MLDLTLDTSSDHAFLLLSHRGHLLDQREIPSQSTLSASFMPTLQHMLLDANCSPQEIEHIFVGVGPGSYVGTRTAVTVALCLSFALQIPLYPFCSLLAFMPQSLPDGSFSYIMHAIQGRTFFLQGTIENGRITPYIHTSLIEDQFLQVSSFYLSTHPEETKKRFPHFPLPQPRVFSPHILLPYLQHLLSSPPEEPAIFYLHHC